ncbi:MAG: hypothetical protein JKY65_23410 [Planctomycetes bacterium]|nr:hypothetical protein [Planctomycetota bacterium]
MDELFEAVLAGEHGEDLTPAESEAFEAWLGSERGVELLGAAEAELDPLADAFDPTDPSAEAWSRVSDAVMSGLDQSGSAAKSGVVVRPPELAADRNWGMTALLAAGLLFAAAVGLVSMGPGDGPGQLNVLVPTPSASQPLAKAPKLAASPIAPLAPPTGPAASVDQLEAGEGYEAVSAIVKEALLVITIQAKED